MRDITPDFQESDPVKNSEKLPTMRSVATALSTLSSYAHITVDVHNDPLDATLNNLKGAMDGIMNRVFPLLNQKNNGPLEYRDENGGDSLLFKALEKALFPESEDHFKDVQIPELKNRYSDFPEVVSALEIIENVVEREDEWKAAIRQQTRPETVDNIRKQVDAGFRSTPIVKVPHSSKNDTESARRARVEAFPQKSSTKYESGLAPPFSGN